jgi:hypothetical protein
VKRRSCNLDRAVPVPTKGKNVTETLEHTHGGSCHSAGDLLEAVPGLSYRQIDHWSVKGWLRAVEVHPGHGVQRCWSDEEVEVARRALQLIRLGFTASKATHFARTPTKGIMALLEHDAAVTVVAQ